MKKGIFWVFITEPGGYDEIPELCSVSVECDINGNALEEADFTSKSGENFNHKLEWKKNNGFSREGRNKPFDYFPRGRVEIKNGRIRVFAHPYIINDDVIRELIIDSFELDGLKGNIHWLADNSIHYQSEICSQFDEMLDDDNDKGFPHIDFSKIKIDAVVVVDDVRKYSSTDIRKMVEELRKNKDENKENE